MSFDQELKTSCSDIKSPTTLYGTELDVLGRFFCGYKPEYVLLFSIIVNEELSPRMNFVNYLFTIRP
jgi:hypothetical protein